MTKPQVLVELAKLKFLNCGLGQLCLHLGKSLLSHGQERIIPTFLLPQERAELFPDFAGTIPVRPWHRSPWLSLSANLGLSISRRPIDVWHCTHQDSAYWAPRAEIPVVLNILDLNFLHDGSGGSKIQRRLRRLQAKVERASLIVVISQFVADEVRQYLDVGSTPIEVIHMGVDSPQPLADASRPSFLPDGPFLYTIGDITAKKNFHTLVEFAERLPDYRVVIAGNKSSQYAQELEQQVLQQGMEDRVILPGQVSETDRQWLYQHCAAFLFPSLAEGFGMPVIEAMKLGTPVFVSNRTSLPEVAGPHGFYWDSFEPEAMVKVFQDGMSVADSTEYRQQLVEWGGRFTWQAAVEKYLSAYERVARSVGRKAA